jgi:hypothetical protein
MTKLRYVRLLGQARRLDIQCEDLIAAGVDPAELLTPLHPVPLGRSRSAGRHAELPPALDIEEAQHARDLASVWLIVAVACLAAFAGCAATAGAMMIVTQDLTWHAVAAGVAGIGWFIGALAAARTTDRLYRAARAGAAGA